MKPLNKIRGREEGKAVAMLFHKNPEEYLRKASLELFRAKIELYAAIKLDEDEKNKRRFFLEVTVSTVLASSGTFILTPDVMVRMYVNGALKRVKKSVKLLDKYLKSTRSGSQFLIEDVKNILLECIDTSDYREMYEKVSQALSMLQSISQPLRFLQ